MSVSGPCAWVSTMPSPAAAHPSSITSSWASVSWNSEPALTKSRADLSALSGLGKTVGEPDKASPTEMQPAAYKAENAFPMQPAAGSSDSVQYSGVDVPSKGLENRNTNAHSDSSSTANLERQNADIQGPGESQTNDELSSKVKSEEVHEDEKDHGEVNAGSSDDDGSVADEKKSSQDVKLDKKKMKRFRYVV